MAEQQSKSAEGQKGRKRNPLVLIAFLIIITAAVAGSMVYWEVTRSRVYVEDATVSAPVISLSPSSAGIIDRVLVKEGDMIRKNMVVAQVEGIPIVAKADGLVIGVENTPGAMVGAQSSVVKMIEPKELKIIGRVKENKGLSDIHPGQYVRFSVDAFRGKRYKGAVESILPTSAQSKIAFSISDKREEKEFDIKIEYDLDAYPELKNGMSAKLWIYK